MKAGFLIHPNKEDGLPGLSVVLNDEEDSLAMSIRGTPHGFKIEMEAALQLKELLCVLLPDKPKDSFFLAS